MSSGPGLAPEAAELVAGPPRASPPLFIALLLVALSIAGPFVFLADGTPSLLLGITAMAVAIAGMITLVAAVRAHLRRQEDAAIRRRVLISPAGITFYPSRASARDAHFAWKHVTSAHLAQSVFYVEAAPDAPRPGRHAIRFGKLVTPRADIISRLDEFRAKVDS